MKKSMLILLADMLLLFVSCQPINPPQSDEDVVKIIEILYNGLGQPADASLRPLAEMGYDIPYYLPDSRSGYDEGYYIKTGNYEISIACNHDSVLLARYGYLFQNTYVDGVKKFHIADDAVYDIGWEQWIGGYNSKYNDLSLHDEASIDMDSCVREHRDAHLGIHSLYQKTYADKYILASVGYWGVSIGGMNPVTGEGRGSMADSDITIEFSLRDSSNSAFDQD